MEKDHLKRYTPSTGDRSSFYRETTAANDRAVYNSSAAMGNLADVMKKGPVTLPNILAPNAFRRIPIETRELPESDAKD